MKFLKKGILIAWNRAMHYIFTMLSDKNAYHSNRQAGIKAFARNQNISFFNPVTRENKNNFLTFSFWIKPPPEGL
jgi:hypothetical protein